MPTVLKESSPTARKTHQCGMCARQIEVGETYSRDTLIWDDGPYDWIECADCQRDHICNEVHAWTGGYYDEGVGLEQADEWAHEMVNHAKTADLREIAAAWLKRNGCKCEDCEPRIRSEPT